MMDIAYRELGNSRIIYCSVDIDQENWQRADGELLKFIEQHPKIHLAHDKTYIYFDESRIVKVGREITGHPGESYSRFDFFDQNSGRIISIPLKKEWFDISLDEVIFEGKKNMREIPRQEGQKVSLLWRIELDWERIVPKVYFNYFF